MKKDSTYFMILLIITISITLLDCKAEPKTIPTSFDIKKGVNIGNWLSQSNIRGEQRAANFTTADIDRLSSYGFDHLRLPVDEEQVFTESGEIDKDAMGLAHQIIQQCRKQGMKVIFDLHITRSHRFSKDENAIWTSKKAQKEMVILWEKLTKELEQYPEELVSYELLNEPVAPEDEQWNNVAMKLIKCIRKSNKRRVIVLGANRWNSVDHINNLRIPKNDSNIILSFHFYEPLLLTHYQASWNSFAKLTFGGAIEYPGLLISDSLFNSLSLKDQLIVKPYVKQYSKEIFLQRWSQAIDYAKSKGLKLHLGEFGCLPYIGQEKRMTWLKDIVSLCRENDIAYTLWEYNNVFGFAEKGTGKIKNEEMLRLLVE